MDLFSGQARTIAIIAYTKLCVKYDNVWGKTPPIDQKEKNKIQCLDRLDYEDEEIELHFNIFFSTHYYIVNKIAKINGQKVNRKRLQNYI